MHFSSHIGPARWASPNGKSVGSFKPNGKPQFTGNPEGWASTDPLLSARLFVGFSVGQKATYKVDDLIKVVTRIRKRQGRALDSSFLVQRGIYTSKLDGKTVTEDGAQVVMLNLDGLKQGEFEEDMVVLGEGIAKAMKQEEVIVELQRGGITKKVIGVVP